MENIIKIIVAGVTLLGLGYGIGRYVQPAKIEVKKEEVVREIEVTKKNTVTREKTTQQKDGTLVTEKITEENIVSTNQTDIAKKEEKLAINTKPNWRVRGGAGLDLSGTDMLYTGGIEKRIIGPVFLGIDIDAKTSYKVDSIKAILSYEF